MKRILTNKYFLFLIRITVSYIFIYAGAVKISDTEAFAISISNYRLLAITLPWLEIIAGILLLFGIAVKENSTIIFAMISIFTVAIIISLFRGLSIDCGCFGKGTQIGLMKLGENLLMIVGLLILIVYGSDFLKLKSD